jgi:hypothetical protein
MLNRRVGRPCCRRRFGQQDAAANGRKLSPEGHVCVRRGGPPPAAPVGFSTRTERHPRAASPPLPGPALPNEAAGRCPAAPPAWCRKGRTGCGWGRHRPTDCPLTSGVWGSSSRVACGEACVVPAIARRATPQRLPWGKSGDWLRGRTNPANRWSARPSPAGRRPEPGRGTATAPGPAHGRAPARVGQHEWWPPGWGKRSEPLPHPGVVREAAFM